MTTLEDQLRAYGRELDQLSDTHETAGSFVEREAEVIGLVTPDVPRPRRRRRFLVGVSALGIGAVSVFGLHSAGQQAASGPRFAEVAMATPDTHFVLGYVPTGFLPAKVSDASEIVEGRSIVVGQVKNGKVSRSTSASVLDRPIIQGGFTVENVKGRVVRTQRSKFDGVEQVSFQLPEMRGCEVTFFGFGQTFEETLSAADQFSCVDGAVVVRPSRGNELLYDGKGGGPSEPSTISYESSGGGVSLVRLFAARTRLPSPILESMTYDAAPTAWKVGDRKVHVWESPETPAGPQKSFVWQEREDITVNLEVEGNLSRDEVGKMIESVRRVEPAEWAALLVASKANGAVDPDGTLADIELSEPVDDRPDIKLTDDEDVPEEVPANSTPQAAPAVIPEWAAELRQWTTGH
jgi:hypothetical protein